MNSSPVDELEIADAAGGDALSSGVLIHATVLLAFVNLDSAVIDVELISRRFRADNPGGTLVFTTDALGDVPAWDVLGRLRWQQGDGRLRVDLGGAAP